MLAEATMMSDPFSSTVYSGIVIQTPWGKQLAPSCPDFPWLHTRKLVKSCHLVITFRVVTPAVGTWRCNMKTMAPTWGGALDLLFSWYPNVLPKPSLTHTKAHGLEAGADADSSCRLGGDTAEKPMKHGMARKASKWAQALEGAPPSRGSGFRRSNLEQFCRNVNVETSLEEETFRT